MPKGNNYPTLPTEAQVQAALAVLAQLADALAFVPNVSPDLLTSATLTPERLGLADKALAVVQAAPTVMRRSFEPAAFGAKLSAYRRLLGPYNQLAPLHEKLKNGLNVLGSDLLFAAGNIHEDVEKDNGETLDLGTLRTELHAYYGRPGARKPKGGDK